MQSRGLCPISGVNGQLLLAQNSLVLNAALCSYDSVPFPFKSTPVLTINYVATVTITQVFFFLLLFLLLSLYLSFPLLPTPLFSPYFLPSLKTLNIYLPMFLKPSF